MITVEDVKKHCRVDDNESDELLQSYLDTAINYAEMYQHRNYTVDTEGNPIEAMSDSTKQAVRLMVCFWFDNRDMSYNNSAAAWGQNKTMEAVNNLLYFERRLSV